MKSILIVLLSCGAVVADDTVEQLKRIAGDAPQASSGAEAILLNEASSLIDDEARLKQRKESFPGDLEKIKSLLKELRAIAEPRAETQLESEIKSVNAQAKAVAEKKAWLAKEFSKLQAMLNGCGEDCDCGPNCRCVNGECIEIRVPEHAAVAPPKAPTVRPSKSVLVCRTNGKANPYPYEGCDCEYCKKKARELGYTVPSSNVNVQVQTSTRGGKWVRVKKCNGRSCWYERVWVSN